MRIKEILAKTRDSNLKYLTSFCLTRTKVLIMDPCSLLQLRHFLQLDVSFRHLLCLFWAFLSLLKVCPLHPQVSPSLLWVSVFLSIRLSPEMEFQTEVSILKWGFLETVSNVISNAKGVYLKNCLSTDMRIWLQYFIWCFSSAIFILNNFLMFFSNNIANFNMQMGLWLTCMNSFRKISFINIKISLLHKGFEQTESWFWFWSIVKIIWNWKSSLNDTSYLPPNSMRMQFEKIVVRWLCSRLWLHTINVRVSLYFDFSKSNEINQDHSVSLQNWYF